MLYKVSIKKGIYQSQHREKSVGNPYIPLGGVALNGSSAPVQHTLQTPSFEHTLPFGSLELLLVFSHGMSSVFLCLNRDVCVGLAVG